MNLVTTGTMMGGLASLSMVMLWLMTFHQKFFRSLWNTQKVTAYGVYTDFGEAMRSHFWFLARAKLGLAVPDRKELEAEVKSLFLKEFLTPDQLEDPETSSQVVVKHSCRSIFYYMIKTLLEEAEERTGRKAIKIALPAVHFGSFFRLVQGMEKSMGCTIEYYEVDLNEEDWTLNEDLIDEKEIASCNLVMCQHLFGLPFGQNKLFQLAKKYNLPILEDCVQSGSLYGNYKGDPRSDVVMYSGGLDKTPQSFGAGLGYFRNTHYGNHYYQKCNTYHESLPMDTWKARLISCFNQLVHVMIAKNSFGINNLLGLIAYVLTSDRGESIKWYALSLMVRKNKSVTPFQHAESGFLRRPTVFQLQSLKYAMTTKRPHYLKIAQGELDGRDLLLKSIPTKYHGVLFPWYTPEVLQAHRDNRGVSEFTWVVSPKGDRMDLCEFLNDHFVVTLINTTWEYDPKANSPVSKDINDNLVYLPNINQMTPSQIQYTASILTKYCDQWSATATTTNGKAKAE